jgi:hypothetical protein
MDFEQLMQGVKSAKELNTNDMQGLYKRYDIMGASGSAANNEVYLCQQSLSLSVVDQVVDKMAIAAMCEDRGIKMEDGYEDRVKIYKASDESVDSAGDIIRQGGWDFTRYKTNPVFAYCHDYHALPIGTALKWQVKDGALYIWNMFATKEGNPWAEMCLNMVNQKMLNGNSVGFIPKKVLRVEDEAERTKLGLGKYGVVFEKSLLLEDSACAIGCNPAALVQEEISKAIQKGIVSTDDLDRILKDDTGFKAPDSLKIQIDRAKVIAGKSAIISISEIKTESTSEFKIDTDVMDSLFSKISERFDNIDKQIIEIKADTANMREKQKSVGNDGNSLESETDTDKGYFDLVLSELKSINKTVNNQQKVE